MENYNSKLFVVVDVRMLVVTTDGSVQTLEDSQKYTYAEDEQCTRPVL